MTFPPAPQFIHTKRTGKTFT